MAGGTVRGPLPALASGGVLSLASGGVLSLASGGVSSLASGEVAVTPPGEDAPMAPEPSPFARRSADPHRIRRPRTRRGAIDDLPVWLRRTRVEVLLWAFRSGRPVDGAALTVVLAAKHARDGETFAQWTRHSVRALLWVDIPEWCEARAVPVPAAAPVTMWALLDHLAERDAFGPGSDPLPLLREPLVDSGGLDRHGRPRVRASLRGGRHPAQLA
jgi:hypothetical protein